MDIPKITLSSFIVVRDTDINLIWIHALDFYVLVFRILFMVLFRYVEAYNKNLRILSIIHYNRSNLVFKFWENIFQHSCRDGWNSINKMMFEFFKVPWFAGVNIYIYFKPRDKKLKVLIWVNEWAISSVLLDRSNGLAKFDLKTL